MPSTLHSRRSVRSFTTQANALLPAPPHRCIPQQKRSQARAQHQSIHAIHQALHGSLPHLDPRTHLHLAHHALSESSASSLTSEPLTSTRHPSATSSSRQQEIHLIHWAQQNGLHLHRAQLPAAYQPPTDTDDDSQMEHHVWPHASGHRVLKLTHLGHFGMWPIAHGSGWDMHTQPATPLRYLSRLLAANTHLGDDFVLHAIITDHLGRAQILTSQPAYSGITPGDIIAAAPEHQQARLRQQQQALICHALATHSFHPTAHSPSTFYRPTDNLAMFDAHFHNLIWHETPHDPLLIPFDVILMHPNGSLRRNILRSLLPLHPEYHQIPPAPPKQSAITVAPPPKKPHPIPARRSPWIPSYLKHTHALPMTLKSSFTQVRAMMPCTVGALLPPKNTGASP